MNDELQIMFEEIRKMHQNYQTAIEGRKQIIKNIREKIASIKDKTSIYNSELNELQDYYEYRDYYVSSYELALRLILRLANSLENIYDLKEVYAVDFINEGDETRRIRGKAIIIGENKALEEMINQKEYYYDELSAFTTRIINDNNSLVIVTYNMLDGNVKPRLNDLHKYNYVDIKNSGLIGNISCYLHDDSLKKAVKMLMNYIDINGPDFRNINEDELYQLIVDYSKRNEVKTKKKVNK